MTEAQTDGLMPCPFCGGEAIHKPGDPDGMHWHNIECDNLCCSIETNTKAEAFAAWNTRAPVHAAWRGIESIPKQGQFLLWCSDGRAEWPSRVLQPVGVVMGHSFDGYVSGVGMNGDWTFTHWMPLPPAPGALPPVTASREAVLRGALEKRCFMRSTTQPIGEPRATELVIGFANADDAFDAMEAVGLTRAALSDLPVDQDTPHV